MNFVHKTLGLLLCGLALSSCGGGGSDGHGAFASPQSGHITLTPAGNSTVLPLNLGEASPWSPASPYTNEVDIHWTNADGTPVSGHDLTCSITNLAVISIHILDDASTTNVDESAIDWGNVQVHSDTGHAICWVFSTGQAGTATLNVGGTDPVTGGTVSASLNFTVQNASGSNPASVTMSAQPPGVYISGSGGSQTSVLTVNVLDGGLQPVPDPDAGNSGVDNVLLEIVTNPSGDARLSANAVTGPVSGASVATHTVHGVATASFQAGTVQGPIQVRATADRSDNNVTNGIADPVSATFSVIVSDGKLYSLEITSPVVAPNLPGITVNSVSGDVSSDGSGIPPDPDATLSLVVSALGTDRQGNPVLPGTSIRFGAVDEPVGAPGTVDDNVFLISGTDGNPQEGGTLFTAPTGQFQTAGGGAGPGDALVVFGKAVEGNSDLVSAVTVASVNSQTSLTASSPFNRNDTTGVSVDYGSVLPYLIGRAQHGNISSPESTNDIGVAHTTLNYTVNSVGSAVAIWAEGDGVDNVTNGQRSVVDAGTLVYPGVAPATLLVSPLTIAGNTTNTITVCVTDALGIPLRGVQVGFLYSLTGAGSGSVDGTPNTGTFDHLTGLDGCTQGTSVTSGIGGSSAGGTAGTLTISAAGQSQDITITAPIVHTLTINVNATSAGDPSGTYTVTLNSNAFSPPTGQGTSCQATVPNPPASTTTTCTFTFTEGAIVSLAESGAGDTTPGFAGWTGDCTNSTNPTSSVTMSGDATCTATW
jgi:uncharacterized repeat protein (TIGR02543 family)